MVELVLSCVDRVRTILLQSCGDIECLSSGTCKLDEPERTNHVNGRQKGSEALADSLSANACIDSGTSQDQYSAVPPKLRGISRASLANTSFVTSARL
jgi:hypothetical protein